MKLLLDTHIFLWAINEPDRLSAECFKLIRDCQNEVYLSVISLWECIIKAETGKLEIQRPVFSFLMSQIKINDFKVLSFSKGALEILENLSQIHKDPFDRLLICQALEFKLTFLTEDKIILKYPEAQEILYQNNIKN